MDKNIRNSNHELMRIVSMFLIVLGHILLHGKVLPNCTNPSLKYIYNTIEIITLVHVNSFVLVTGYYQSKSNFKQSKLWQLINSSWFYRVIIITIFIALNLSSVDKITLLKELSPLTINEYWFIKIYLILYCISPFLNKLIDNLTKKQYDYMLIVGFIIFSILPNITAGEILVNYGTELTHFIYMYLVGAYLRIYPINKSYLFKRTSKNLYRIILLIIFISCVILKRTLIYYANDIAGINSILDIVSKNINSSFFAYSSPITVIESISYFLLLTSLDFKSKFINNVSKLTFGVYLIHENNFIRNYLYDWSRITTSNINSYRFIPYMFIVALSIFIICSIIEFLRIHIFKFIKNRRISIKLRNSYYNFIHSIKINN